MQRIILCTSEEKFLSVSFAVVRIFLLSFVAGMRTARPCSRNLNRKTDMEQLNRIELRGTVGSVRLQTFSDNMVARLTLATNFAYKDKEGAATIDTSWHSILAREGRNIHDLDKITRGTRLYVQGRLRYQKYVGNDGIERTSADIVASRVVILDGDEPLQYEM